MFKVSYFEVIDMARTGKEGYVEWPGAIGP
jgi:hypothetical protein